MELELTEQEINRRLTSYESSDVTKELNQFGAMLLAEIQQRSSDLDEKATKIAGYSGAALSLFISTFAFWGRNLNGIATVSLLAAMSCVFIAGILALIVWSMTKYSWFSEDEWFKEECISDPDRLQRYHLLAMHGVFQSHKAVCQGKARLIRWAGYVFSFAFVLMIIALYATAL